MQALVLTARPSRSASELHQRICQSTEILFWKSFQVAIKICVKEIVKIEAILSAEDKHKKTRTNKIIFWYILVLQHNNHIHTYG